MLRGVGGPVNVEILDGNGDPVTTGTTAVFVDKDGAAQSPSTAAIHKGNGSWQYVVGASDSIVGHIAVTFVNDAGGKPVTINIYPTRLSDDAYTNLNTKYGNPSFGKGYNVDDGTSVMAPDVQGLVGATPTPNQTSFYSDVFTSTDLKAYIGWRVTFTGGAVQVHAQCVIESYNGAGVVTVTPIPGGAPGVGDAFIASNPRDK